MLSILIVSMLLNADDCRAGRVDKHGRYIPPYCRSKPDKSKYNNYGRDPNINPYTGKKGKQ